MTAISYNKIFWGPRPNKDKARHFVLPEKQIHNGIFLSGSECRDISLAIEKGLCLFAKNIFLIECDKNVYPLMIKNAPKLPFIKCNHSRLENFELNCKIDYANLDFLGTINSSLSAWMSNVLSPKISTGATISITHTNAIRGNKIIPLQDEFLGKIDGVNVRKIYETPNISTQRILILIHRIFCLWDFDIYFNKDDKIPNYIDSVNRMLIFKLMNFRNFRKPSYDFTPL